MSHARVVRTTVLIKPGIAILGSLFAGLIGWTLWQGWEVARDRATGTAGSLVVNLEREMGRVFESLDLSLRAAVRGEELPGVSELSPDLKHAVLFDGAAAAKGLGALAVTNGAGDIVYQSTGLDFSAVNLGDREYFVAHRDHPNLGTVVSRPLQSRGDGQWSVALARRINRPDGGFAGIAVGTVRLSYLDSLIQQSTLYKGTKVSLLSTTGWLVTRWPWPTPERAYGQEIGKSAIYQHLAKSPAGFFTARSSVDQIERIQAYRQIGTLPLAIDVGLSIEDVFVEWFNSAAVFMALILSLGLALAGLGWAFWRELQMRVHSEEQAKVAERAVVSSMARLDALFQNASDAMAVVAAHEDGSFTYESVNPALETSLGLEAAAMIGKTPAECLPSAVARTILEQWTECVKSRQPRRYALTVVMPDRTFECEVFMAPVFDETGRVCRLVGGARDVAERNKLEAQLRQSQKLETVGQLAAGIAHDFNNLLQAILGAVDLLGQQVGEEEKSQQAVAIARKAAYRGASLTHRLLTVSRQQSLSPALLDLRESLSEMVQLFTPVLGPHIRIEQIVEPGLWPVMADVREVETSLMNLAVNARDAMTGGGVLRIGMRNGHAADPGAPDLSAGDYVVICVEDTGAGMEASTMARACDPFFTTKAPGKGSGLGLSMVHGFAAQSGGAMQLRSRVGQGTRVEVWLPRASGIFPIGTSENETGVLGGSGGQILLVDDDAEVRDVLQMLLSDAGYTVTPAESGESALELIQNGIILDVLISDYAMPGMTGAELIKRALEARPGLPALIITGFDAIGPNGGLPCGVRLLRKPLRREELLFQIKATITDRPLNQPDHASPPTAFADNVVQFGGKQGLSAAWHKA